ncbi:MAG: beta-ketoacyl synthase N-terminal-like domain-containing protein, partial [Desulfobacterales bacterium]
MSRRVVITGLGLVTPLGVGVDDTWRALCKGQSGISEITRFDASAFDTKIAGEVKDFHPEDFLPKKEAKRTQEFIAYAVAASRMAIEDSGLTIDKTNESKVGVLTGCGLGGLRLLEQT